MRQGQYERATTQEAGAGAAGGTTRRLVWGTMYIIFSLRVIRRLFIDFQEFMAVLEAGLKQASDEMSSRPNDLQIVWLCVPLMILCRIFGLSRKWAKGLSFGYGLIFGFISGDFEGDFSHLRY